MKIRGGRGDLQEHEKPLAISNHNFLSLSRENMITRAKSRTLTRRGRWRRLMIRGGTARGRDGAERGLTNPRIHRCTVHLMA